MEYTRTCVAGCGNFSLNIWQNFEDIRYKETAQQPIPGSLLHLNN